MPSRKLTLRLTPALEARVRAHCAAHGLSFTDLLRAALITYLETDPPPPHDPLTALAAEVTALAARVTALEQAPRTRPAPPLEHPPRRRRAPQAQAGAPTPQADCPPYDATRFVLGKLCRGKHEWGATGQTLLRLPGHACDQCGNAWKRAKRAAQQRAPLQ